MSENTEETTRATEPSDALSALLRNPESLSKVGEILSRFTSGDNSENPPLNEQNSSPNGQIESTNDENNMGVQDSTPTLQNFSNGDITSRLPEILSLLSSSKGEISHFNRQQTALLLAIKPYLSEHRRQLIDGFIQMNRFGEILKKLI